MGTKAMRNWSFILFSFIDRFVASENDKYFSLLVCWRKTVNLNDVWREQIFHFFSSRMQQNLLRSAGQKSKRNFLLFFHHDKNSFLIKKKIKTKIDDGRKFVVRFSFDVEQMRSSSFDKHSSIPLQRAFRWTQWESLQLNCVDEGQTPWRKTGVNDVKKRWNWEEKFSS